MEDQPYRKTVMPKYLLGKLKEMGRRGLSGIVSSSEAEVVIDTSLRALGASPIEGQLIHAQDAYS